MKKLVLLLAVLVFTLGMSAIVMAETPSNIDYNNMHIEWSDEFNGNALNTNYWECQVGNGSLYGVTDWGNDEKEWYKEDNVSVDNGTLKLTAKKERKGNKDYTSGRIRTWDNNTGKPKVEIGLGYLEARIKVPLLRGVWPAFWMLGNNGKKWPSCGEIDILETANAWTYTQSTIHFPDYDGKDVYIYSQYQPSVHPGFNKTNWNTYGVYRDGSTIAFYVNGEKYCSWKTADDKVGVKSVLNEKYHVLLNMAVGGNWAQQQMPVDGTLPVSTEVDYVRYYQEGAAPTVKPTVKPTTTTVSKPAKAKIKSLKYKKKRKLIVKLKKVAGAQGYQVRWCDAKSFDGYEQKNTKKPKLTIKGLDKNTKYWVKARAFKKVNGAKLYGSWSAKKSKKVKK